MIDFEIIFYCEILKSLFLEKMFSDSFQWTKHKKMIF